MSTPAIDSEIGKSAWVTWRAQPPSWMRLGALLNDAQNIGMSPTSVEGGEAAEGNCSASAGLCGPGSVRLPGLALIAPCGGSSGLPNSAARAAVVATAPAAVAASTSRLEIMATPLVGAVGPISREHDGLWRRRQGIIAQRPVRLPGRQCAGKASPGRAHSGASEVM
jgi:hypothetical protein